MKGERFSKLLFTVSVIFLGVVLLSSLVFAAHVVRTSTGGTSYFVVEDTPVIYNFSINNTDTTTTANITVLNITLPSGFTYTTGTNRTTVSSYTFSNTSTVLTWNNSAALIMNLTGHWFTFNATAANPGNYNFTVVTVNATATFWANISVSVNDTTSPATFTFADPTESDGANLSRNNVTVNVSVTDNGVVDSLVIRLYNSTGSLINTSILAGAPASFLINFTGLADGNYTFNATANDTFNNVNRTTSRFIVVDTGDPSVSLSCSPDPIDTGDTLTCSCDSSDTGSGVRSTSFTTNPSTEETGTHTTTCTVEDYAGNQATDDYEYTVEGGGSGGGSSQGSSTTTSWSRTDDQSSVDLRADADTPAGSVPSVSASLRSRERVKLTVQSVEHHVGIVSLTANSAVIEIASTPRQSTFTRGQTKEFDVNDDNVLDISITLVSIQSNVAQLTIRALLQPATRGDSITNQEPLPEQNQAGNEESASRWMIWVIAIVAIAILVVLIMRSQRSRAPHLR